MDYVQYLSDIELVIMNFREYSALLLCTIVLLQLVRSAIGQEYEYEYYYADETTTTSSASWYNCRVKM